jgi:hypothetical protein
MKANTGEVKCLLFRLACQGVVRNGIGRAILIEYFVLCRTLVQNEHMPEGFGGDLLGFKRTAGSLGGKTKDLADLAHKVSAFPKVPLFYLFWEGGEEIASKVSRCCGWGEPARSLFPFCFE